MGADPTERDAGGADRSLVSIVIPALNEEDSLPRLEEELLSVVDPLPYDFEFLLIDNASTDRTGEMAKEMCRRDSRWRYLRFSRNYTAEMSITAGYRHARGDATIVLYSDLQDPPDVIPELLAKWEEGYDVVFAIHTARSGDPLWRNMMAKIAYGVINAMADVSIPRNAGDYRLISRQVREALNEFGEASRYTRGLIAWLGFPQASVPYERRARAAGESKAPFWWTVDFAINAIVSFSSKPLRLFALFGFAMVGLAMLGGVVYSVLRAVGSPPPGITTIIILLAVAIGVNSMGIGLLGEYLGRTYSEVKRRPLYVVHETMNLADPESVGLPEPRSPAGEESAGERTEGRDEAT